MGYFNEWFQKGIRLDEGRHEEETQTRVRRLKKNTWRDPSTQTKVDIGIT